MPQELGRKDVLRVLNESIKAMQEGNAQLLRELSNRTIHTASLLQDKDSITLAVIVYALSKIVARRGSIPGHVLRETRHCKLHLEKGETRKFQGCLRHVLKAIAEVDNQLKWYIQQVVEQAQIKKGSRIHEHGISLARASELLGVSLWELMGYVGHTNIAEKYITGVGIKKRLDFTRGLFR